MEIEECSVLTCLSFIFVNECINDNFLLCMMLAEISVQGAPIYLVLKCPMGFRSGCPCKWQVTTERTKTQLDRYGIHTETSHQAENSKFLTVPQKSAIKNLVRGNPLMPPSTVRRNLKNMDSSSHVSPHMTPSVRRLVVHARNDLLATFLDDVEMDGSFGSMELRPSEVAQN